MCKKDVPLLQQVLKDTHADMMQSIKERTEGITPLGQVVQVATQLVQSSLIVQPQRYSWNHTVQDRVPAFSPEKAKGFIEKELGAPVNIISKESEERPIAADSLGQVHRSIVHNGEKVVAKVQRPGLKKLFDIDLHCGSVIHSFHPVVTEYFQSETLGGPTRDWMGVSDECAKEQYEENTRTFSPSTKESE
ncbi:protein activity of BC1 complex kinase 7, chloroplastic [Tanacetum coccineum]